MFQAYIAETHNEADPVVRDAAMQAALGLKQDTLVSGTTIKTVNSESLLGPGNLILGATAPLVLSPSDGEANRTTIQTALDAAGTAGTEIMIPVGEWPVAATGTGITRRCIQLTNPADRYVVLLPPGSVLKVADDQITNSNPVTMFLGADHVGGLYIGWPKGKGGSLKGNLTQTGYTNGYTQTQGNAAIRLADTLGGGSENVLIENITIENFYSTSVEIGYSAAGVYGNGTQNIHCRGVTFRANGEAIVFTCVDYCSIVDCVDFRELNKVAGDSFEYAFCRFGVIRDCVADTLGVADVQGGACVDLYGSRDCVVSGCIGNGTKEGLTLQTDFSNAANFCDRIVVSDCVFTGNSTALGGNGIIPSQGGTSSFTNVLVRNFKAAGFQLAAIGNATVNMTNCQFVNNLDSILNSTDGAITCSLNNVTFDTPTGNYGIALSRSSGSNNIRLDWSGGACRNHITAGVNINGTGTFRPTGKISGVSFLNLGGAVPYVLTAGDLSAMVVETTAFLGMVSATSTYNHHGRSVCYFNASPGPLVTLNAGTIYQQLTISFMFEGGSVRDKIANGSGNIRLVGGANKTFARHEVLQLQWVNQTSEWVEMATTPLFTKAQLNGIVSDGDVVYVGDNIAAGAGTATSLSLSMGDSLVGFYSNTTNQIRFRTAEAIPIGFNSAGIEVGVSGGYIGVGTGSPGAGTSDTKWRRGATGPTFDACAAGGFRSRNLAGDADAPAAASNITASGTLAVTGKTTLSDSLILAPSTIAGLPSPATSNGETRRLSDDHNRVVTCDGTDWHYEGTRYVVGTQVQSAIVIKIDTATTGQKKLYLRVPFACTITSWEMVADVSGSVVIDIWKDTYANYPPVDVTDSITGSAKPTLTAAIKAQSSTLTGWTTAIASGDYLEVEVESVTTIGSVTLTLNVGRVG